MGDVGYHSHLLLGSRIDEPSAGYRCAVSAELRLHLLDSV